MIKSLTYTLDLGQFTFKGEVGKKSLILRWEFGLPCVSLLPSFVLSVGFCPFITALVAAPFEFKSKSSLNGWLLLTR